MNRAYVLTRQKCAVLRPLCIWIMALHLCGCTVSEDTSNLASSGDIDMATAPLESDAMLRMDMDSALITDAEIGDAAPAEQRSDAAMDNATDATVLDVTVALDMALQDPDGAVADVGQPALPDLPRIVEGLPMIYDFTGADTEQIDTLVRRALDGLGMDAETGPNPLDRVFVNPRYIAWIDETGFYGKMNGLWALNGDVDQLEFELLDGARPVNTLVVGEFGRGAWPEGYKGAEHIEFPNATPEADDDPSCAASGSFCAQYSLNEALEYTDEDIDAWRSCNPGIASFSDHFPPIEVSVRSDGIRLMYEGPLTKEGDFGGSSTGSNCHRDFLFPDGIRRRVYARVGYDLGVDSHHIDRLIQIRNPRGNPEFDGPFSFIGGFVMSRFPNPHPLKRLHHFVRPQDRAVNVQWNDRRIDLEADAWTAMPTDTPAQDVVLGWANQRVSLSSSPLFAQGKAFSISNHGPNENGDTGFCLCVVHGGIEMGGGLRVGPVRGGVTSDISIRRLTLHDDVSTDVIFTRIYEAETDLNHGVGRAEADGWAANVLDEPGHLIFGPYARDWGAQSITVTFRMMIDVVNASAEEVVTIDVFDATAQEVVASTPLTRRQFNAALQYQDFDLYADLSERLNHQFETRVFWHDISYVRVDRVTVFGQ